MKIVKRILRLLGLTLLGTLTFVVVAITVVFIFPGIVINDSTLRWARPLLQSSAFDLQWKTGHLKARSSSLFSKRIEFRFEKPCYQQSKPFVRACLESIDLVAVVDLRKQTLFVDRLNIPKGQVTVETVADSTPAKEKAHTSPLQTVDEIRRGLLEKFSWNHVDIQAIQILLKAPGQTTTLVGSVQGSAKNESRTISAKAEGTLAQGNKRMPASARASVDIPTKGNLHYSAKIGWANQLSAATNGSLTTESLQGSLQASVKQPLSGFSQGLLNDCKYSWKEEKSKDIQIAVNCPLELQPDAGSSKKSPPWATLFRADPKGLRPVIATATATSTVPGGDFGKTRGKLTLTATDVGAVNLELALDATLDLELKENPLNATLSVTAPDFASLVARLDTTPWAVPAPVNQLTGKITLGAKAQTDLDFKKALLDFSVDSALTSDRQKLAFDGKGSLTANPESNGQKLFLDTTVTFKGTALTLPRLDPTQLPQLFPDPQIVYPKAKAKPSQTSFGYRIKVTTTKDLPIQLHSTQYKLTIPLELDLLVQDGEGMTGHLLIPRFGARLFGRDAKVRRVRIDFPPDGVAELTARVDIEYTDYELTLRAYGQLDAPRYSITSQPPLSENSALSLLLFGRTLEELSPGQGESLGNARAALASGAVSAASMYLLASTPIESIGYDPSNGRFSATVRLLEGTSLRVESAKEGVTQLGLRKRLGRDWVLNTYIERTSPLEDRRSVSTFLEWSKIY